jgi:arsenate reductase
MSIIIYHNAKCSKSNIALKEITQSGEAFEVVNYLDDVPSIEELKGILSKLNLKPLDLVRKTEKVYLEKFKGEDLSDDEWIKALHENPILIQRPIIVNGEKAVIARSEEAINSII